MPDHRFDRQPPPRPPQSTIPQLTSLLINNAGALVLLSPWQAATAVLWWIIGLAGLWLGLLGIAMAVGLARVLRSGDEIPEQYWRTLVDY
ncbi:hypothetical protein [Mycobacterium ulcerans]|uniref:hypothetical protein n=1 Tax=Mycobacterium ulcerans TaxID=1809 RepID=UPI003B9694A4